MTFDGQAVEAVIDVGPRMRGMPTDGTPPVPSMEAVLGNDFRSFGGDYTKVTYLHGKGERIANVTRQVGS